MLKVDAKRAFGPWLLLAIVLYYLTRCSDVFFDLQDRASNPMMTFLLCGAITPVYAVSAVLACLPFATGFLRDVNSGAARMMELRCGRRNFLWSKMLCTVLSGGLALGLGTACFALLINLRLTHSYEYVAEIIAEATYYDISKGFTTGSLIQYYAAACALEFLAGMFYSSIGLAFSAFVPNTSLTLCAVLIGYRVFKEVSFLMPREWMVPIWLQVGSVGLDMCGTLLAALLVLGGGTVLLCTVFYIRAGRRLRDS